MSQDELQDLEFEFVFADFEPWSGDGIGFKQITEAINACGDFCEVLKDAFQSDDDVRLPGLVLTTVSYASPLTVTGAFKFLYSESAQRLASFWHLILNRTVYHDLERERRIVDIQSGIRDVRRKDIENTRALLDMMREYKVELDMTDTAKLLESISVFRHPTTQLSSHRIGPALGGAAVPLAEDTKKPK